MSSKTFRLVVFLLLIAAAVIGVSGCGGSSHHRLTGTEEGTTEQGEEQSSDFDVHDVDNDGTPDVLDFDEVAEFDYTKDELIQSKDISVPSRHYLKRLSYIDSPDTFIVNLTAGTEYTVEISKGDFYQHELGGNIPSVSIFNPSGTRLSFKVDKNSTLSRDVIEHSVYPPSEPYVICYTFTPAVTGRYTISLGQSISRGHIYDDITLFVYKELRNEVTGEAGYYVRYVFYDKDGNASSTLKMEDIMLLRKAWNDASNNTVTTWTDSGDETLNSETIVPSKVENFLNCVRMLKPYYGIFDDYKVDKEAQENEAIYDDDTTASISAAKIHYSKYTRIPADISGILYESKYDLGQGFSAITGIQGQSVAVEGETIKLKVPQTKADARVTSVFKAGFVSSQEEAEEFTSTKAGIDIQLGGFGFSAGHSNSNSYKYGLTSTTYVIHYEETEAEYRKLSNDAYEIRPIALEVLSEDGLPAFRDEYGDYFVAGYQYGGTYDAFIQITTKTTEQLSTIKTTLGGSYKPSSDDVISGRFARETSNLLRNNDATISIEIRTAGINDGGGYDVTKATDLTEITNSLSSFRARLQKTSPAEYHRVHVWLKRYDNISAYKRLVRQIGDPYRGRIPILSSHSTNILAFRQQVAKMHGYYSIIRDTDNKIMDQGVKNSYEQRCRNIDNIITAESEALFDSDNAQMLQDKYDELLKLNEDLIAIGDRYVFFRLLNDARNNEYRFNDVQDVLEKPYGPKGGSIGYENFASSAYVNADIEAGHYGMTDKRFKFEINRYVDAEYNRYPSFEAPDGEVFCFAQVTATNEYDRVRNSTTIPALGTRRMGFHFTCGIGRWMQWKVITRTMRFTQDLYPFSFVGLNQ